MTNPAKIKKLLSQTSLVLAAGMLPAAAFGGVFVITDDACPAAHGDLEAHLNWESGIATSHGRSVGSGAGLEFAYGATAEYLVIAGDTACADMWERRYREEIERRIALSPSGAAIPPRRWI